MLQMHKCVGVVPGVGKANYVSISWRVAARPIPYPYSGTLEKVHTMY